MSDPENETMEEYEERITSITLPQWIKDITEDQKPRRMVTSNLDASGMPAIFVEGDSTAYYDMDDVRKIVDDSLESYTYIFDDSLNRVEWGNNKLGPNWYVEANGTLILGDGDIERFHIYSSYYHHLERTEEYHKNRDDWVLAYHWLNGHPLFWSRHDVSKIRTMETESGLSTAWISPGRHENGNTYVMLEHGGAVPPERGIFYHDTLLDVVESTFEEAYVAFAKNVDRYFHKDGTERKAYKKAMSRFIRRVGGDGGVYPS